MSPNRIMCSVFLTGTLRGLMPSVRNFKTLDDAVGFGDIFQHDPQGLKNEVIGAVQADRPHGPLGEQSLGNVVLGLQNQQIAVAWVVADAHKRPVDRILVAFENLEEKLMGGKQNTRDADLQIVPAGDTADFVHFSARKLASDCADIHDALHALIYLRRSSRTHTGDIERLETIKSCPPSHKGEDRLRGFTFGTSKHFRAYRY